MVSKVFDRKGENVRPIKMMRFIFLLIFMQIVSVSSFPQSSKLDSLKSLLKAASGNEKGHLLNEIGKIESGEKALIYYDQALAEATDSIVLARAFCNKAIVLKQLGRMKEAEQLLEQTVPHFAKVSSASYFTLTMYSVLGQIYMFSGRYSSAIELLHKSLSMSVLEGDSVDVAADLFLLGLLHYKIRKNEKALELFDTARAYLPHDRQVNFYFYLNSSLCLSEMGNTSLGLEYCTRAIDYTDGNTKRLLQLEFATGLTELKSGNASEARRMFLKSLTRSIQLKDARMQADNMLYIGKTLISDAQIDSAFQMLKRAEELASLNRFNEILLDVYRCQIQISSHVKNYLQLSAYQQKFISLKQEVYNIGVEKKLADLESDWREKENSQLIDLQRSEIDERIKALSYQQWISRALYAIVSLVIFIIAIYLWGLYSQKQSQRLLENQVHSRVRTIEGVRRLTSGTGVESQSDAVHKLSEIFDQCCRDSIIVLKSMPRQEADDLILKCIDRIEADHLNRSTFRVGHAPSRPICLSEDIINTQA